MHILRHHSGTIKEIAEYNFYVFDDTSELAYTTVSSLQIAGSQKNITLSSLELTTGLFCRRLLNILSKEAADHGKVYISLSVFDNYTLLAYEGLPASVKAPYLKRCRQAAEIALCKRIVSRAQNIQRS